MRHFQDDGIASPDRLFLPPRYAHTLVDVAGDEHDAAAGVLRDFFEGLSPAQLRQLLASTASSAGFGHDLAASMYDDDLERGDPRFHGVLIRSHIRDDETVLSRAAYERLIAALATGANLR